MTHLHHQIYQTDRAVLTVKHFPLDCSWKPVFLEILLHCHSEEPYYSIWLLTQYNNLYKVL